ncbi:hypothetical protein QAD02_000624 [Eretmocerus hayati]|uniref:Uncharacterized protein n=1 Tax=Eretmocerus hayati TaxID=131215 RepID=A0ACC2NDY5_9HYME|nr:hypothetical protein QAD02_000624 [Eretmocerus hayati]
MDITKFKNSMSPSKRLLTSVILLFVVQYWSPVFSSVIRENECKGVYDKSIFAKLDRICVDCYNLFREPQLHNQCRHKCFTTDYFEGCIDVLMLQDQKEKIKKWVAQIHGAVIGTELK